MPNTIVIPWSHGRYPSPSPASFRRESLGRFLRASGIDQR
jgi:hypothetical protein